MAPSLLLAFGRREPPAGHMHISGSFVKERSRCLYLHPLLRRKTPPYMAAIKCGSCGLFVVWPLGSFGLALCTLCLWTVSPLWYMYGPFGPLSLLNLVVCPSAL